MFLEPMLLEKAEKPFDDSRFIYEPKIDGHRMILSKINGSTRLYTRHNNDCTLQYPELHNIPIDCDVILDGEVYCIDENGNIDFELIMSRFHTKGSDKIKNVMKRLPVQYMVFDILYLDGRDLRSLPLLQRKEILQEIVPDKAPFHKIQFIEGYGTALFEAIKKQDMEGIVCKRSDSIYVGKRSSDWRKVLNLQYAEIYISGYRKKEFGWLASVPDISGRFRHAGVIELGVPPSHKQAFREICRQLVTSEDKDFVYLDPRLKATVKFRNWTKSGMLRSPVFVDFVLNKR